MLGQGPTEARGCRVQSESARAHARDAPVHHLGLSFCSLLIRNGRLVLDVRSLTPPIPMLVEAALAGVELPSVWEYQSGSMELPEGPEGDDEVGWPGNRTGSDQGSSCKMQPEGLTKTGKNLKNKSSPGTLFLIAAGPCRPLLVRRSSGR